VAEERLQKILSNAGVASRRVAEEMILAGRVAVNGETVRTLGARANPESDEVTVDGVPVHKGRYRYFALNKPVGFVTTARDDQGRETVLDLVPIAGVQLHPVGRLDVDSEGLVILTTDGNLTDLLTHPRYEVEKEYLVGLDAMPPKRDLERLVRGVEEGGERMSAASVHPASPPKDAAEAGANAWLLIALKEGKNREIRRMMAALGRNVIALRRVRVGPLALGMLGSGSFRELTEEEVDRLYTASGGKAPAPQGTADRGEVSASPNPKSTIQNPKSAADLQSPE
jgi:23S rRNA pseudouridine2605 synthase